MDAHTCFIHRCSKQAWDKSVHMWGDEKCGLPVISMQKRAASEAKGGREHLWVHTQMDGGQRVSERRLMAQGVGGA